MNLLTAFTNSIRRAVAQAVEAGIADGVKAVLGDAKPQLSGQDEAHALLLAWTPVEQDEQPKRRRQA